jgi:copper chaperone CopZ
MKKRFAMENLDCAVCAAKMEEAIGKIPGVTSASVSFLTQKLTLEGDESRWEEILEEAEKACKKVDSACRICR